MASKLLHSLADDNPDLQKQIGCMTGIFQLFDRHHVLAARHIDQKRLPPPPANSLSGNSQFRYGRLEKDSNNLNQHQTTSEVSSIKGMSEKQRISTESSRASFSSCSSSLSSVDFRAQADASFDHTIFPETSSRESIMNQTTVSARLGQQSLDLRDVVKDSMYREARGLSMKTAAKEDALIHNMKRSDSPRPPQLSNLVDGSYGVGTDENGNQRMPVDLRESYRVLAKLRETPWYYHGEARELPRPSNEVKDGHGYLISKDAPRFSYDGRETSCLSFESRNAIKGPPKPKERPRLSLDSREGSWGTYSYDSKTNHLLRGLGSGTSTSDDKVSSLPQSLASQRRPPSVVAKLMGLETLPNSFLSADTQSSWSETPSVQYDGQFPRSTENGLIKPLKVFSSPKSSLKDPSSPRRKNPDLVMKPISSSRFPIEPAPWKQPDGNKNSQKSSSGAMKSPARTQYSFPSVYSEIEKRLKNLEFKQSERDLRALQQIMETMHEKGLLETKKEEQALNVVSQQNPQGNSSQLSSRRGGDLARTCESPIVIMKPTKLVEKNGNSASSVISLGRLSGAHKLDSGSNEDKKKAETSIQIAKDVSPKNNRRDASANHNDKKESSSKTARSSQSQPRSQQFSKENSSSSVKNSGSVRLRMQQKKLEFERRNPQYPPPDSNKPRRKPSKQVTDSGSQGGKQRPKSPNLQHDDHQQIQMRNESRASSSQGDEIFMQFDCVAVSNSNMDMEVSSSLQSADTNDSQSPSLKDIKRSISRLMQKKSTPRLDEDESFAELATSSQEHASPVSVLDASVYRDDEPSSVNQISNSHKVDDAREYKGNEDEDPWNPVDKMIYNTGSREMNRKKLQSIDQLVQKLRRVNSSHDESRYDYIASLCENTSPDQRYISEILVASGLLLRDLSSELLTFQLHSSGHPINPELFFVLEQTKASSLLLNEECSSERVAKLKLNAGKNHRKLIFDVVNEILSVKLALVGSSSEPWVKPSRITKKTLSAQKLLKELCFEIEKIQSKKKPERNLENEEDSLKSILREDVMCELESWIDFHGELSGVVLDVERMIFKDLINEIVIGESSCQRIIKPSRRKKLFGK